MSLYEKYINDEIEIKDLSQDQFNQLMIEWYADYKTRNGTQTFQEFLSYMNDYIL